MDAAVSEMQVYQRSVIKGPIRQAMSDNKRLPMIQVTISQIISDDE